MASGVVGASSIVAELIKQTHVLRGASSAMATAGPPAPTGQVATSGGLSEALEAAFSAAPFVKFRAAMQRADLLSTAGRRQAFEAATEGDCLLAIRLLVAGEPTLARRDEALGTLMNLRPFLAEWSRTSPQSTPAVSLTLGSPSGRSPSRVT